MIDARYANVPLHLRITHPGRPRAQSGAHVHKERRWQDEWLPNIRRLLAEGWSMVEIAADLRVDPTWLRRRFDEHIGDTEE